MYRNQQGLIKDPNTLTNVMDSFGQQYELVDVKTTVADIYLDVSEPFYTVPLKNCNQQNEFILNGYP